MSFVVFINGVLMIVFGLMMALVALFFPATRADFTDAAMVSTVAGILLCLAVANRLTEFRRLHAFLLTASIWITGAAVGGLPLWFWQLSPATPSSRRCRA